MNITIAADAPRTARDITVTTDDEVAVGAGLFTVTAQPVNLSPSTGTQGETITQLTVTGGSGGYDGTTGASLGEGIVIIAPAPSPAKDSTTAVNRAPAKGTPVVLPKVRESANRPEATPRCRLGAEFMMAVLLGD